MNRISVTRQSVKSLSVKDTKQRPIFIERKKNFNHSNNNNGYDKNSTSDKNPPVVINIKGVNVLCSISRTVLEYCRFFSFSCML